MSELQIGKKKIGNGYPVYIIAEGCDNHMGDVEVAKEMCRQAKLAGADCIKFQHHLPDEEMLSDAVIAGKNNIPLYEFLKQHALTLKQHRELMEYCKKIGIQYLCTPFSLKAAYELDAMGVDAFKIGSGEMTDIPTLVRIARLGKPMIVSTGMSTIEEIRRTYDVLNRQEFLLLLQTVSLNIRQSMRILTLNLFFRWKSIFRMRLLDILTTHRICIRVLAL